MLCCLMAWLGPQGSVSHLQSGNSRFVSDDGGIEKQDIAIRYDFACTFMVVTPKTLELLSPPCAEPEVDHNISG